MFGRVELRHLVEHRPDDRGGQVIGAQFPQRSFAGSADRGAGGGDDDGVGGVQCGHAAHVTVG